MATPKIEASNMEIPNKQSLFDIKKLLHILNKFTIFFILLAMVIILSIIEPNFLTSVNLLNIVRQITLIAIIGFGLTMIIITTGIDLSPGSIVAIVSVASAMYAHPGEYPLVVSIIVGLLLGVAAGLINGLIVSNLKIPAFIVTLGMMISARGVSYIFSDGHPITGFSKDFDFIGRGYVFGIPFMIYVLVLVGIVSHIILRHTRLGKSIYAIGGNEQAAVVSGINVKRTLLFVYMYGGLMAGVAGIMLASRIGAGQPTAGLGYELDAIAAVVIGGTSLMGGVGTIVGTLIGALIIGVLNNGMDLMHVSGYWQQVLKGVIIVGAIILDKYRNQ
ncbi:MULTISPECIES: ABC transporter permease [Paenibacillus]|nr:MULTISPECIES: ABC transporter permease [Paenibacillus]